MDSYETGITMVSDNTEDNTEDNLDNWYNETCRRWDFDIAGRAYRRY